MNFVPEPLHPALVHFPIVLILLGTICAVAAVFWRKHSLPLLAAVLLGMGALGAWAAVATGESDGGLLENGSPKREALVDEHETWAKRTLTFSIAAAVMAAGSVLAGRWPRIARVVAIVSALVSAVAAYGVYETGHRGGALVYRHGAGVELAVTAPDKTTEGPAESPKSGRDAD